MKVLWIVNSVFPEFYDHLDKDISVRLPISGGWMFALYKNLKKVSDFDLNIVTVYEGTETISKKIDNTNYFLLPINGKRTSYHSHLEKDFHQLKSEIRPDIIHIHGTEFPHSLAFINGCGVLNTIASIQGLVSVIVRYYYSGMSLKDIVYNLTLRNIILFDGVIGQKRQFKKRGKYEIQCISKLKYVMGRTTWDKVHSKTINPNIKYFHLDRVLREEFYKSIKWSYENCEPNSIFISQASYPIKGLHILLKALNIVKIQYPDVKLYIGGPDFTSKKTLYRRLAYSGYGKYINKLIKKHQLKKHVAFLGSLNASEMVNNYLKCNVYVLPSCIENSPNSVSEAQILGTPTIAADVGGVRDLTNDGKYAYLYRFEEYEILSVLIINVFNNSNALSGILNEAISFGEKRLDETVVTKGLIDIYKIIAKRP